MTFVVKIRDKAKIDLMNLAEYYENARRGSGIEFVEIFEHYVTFLETNPARGSRKYKDFREFPMRKFPVIIIYKVLQTEIIIFSLFQANQNPSKKYSE